MERLNLFAEPNLSLGANPSAPNIVRKPFYWNIRHDNDSGAIVASLQHHRRSFTGSITVMESSEEFIITKTRYKNDWQLRPSTPENAAPLMTASHPIWWRRMIEFELHDQRFVMSTKRRMGYEFAVHKVTSNLNASKTKRRELEKEGELVGEISVKSMRKFKLRVSFNQDLGLTPPLFCTWLVYAMGLSNHINTRYSEPQESISTGNHHDNIVWGSSHDDCFDDHNFDVGSGAFGDSSSCGMDSGGGSTFD